MVPPNRSTRVVVYVLIYYCVTNSSLRNDFRPKINQEVSVDVIATEEMSQLTYQIIGRGDVIISRSLQVPNSRNFNFRFLASFAMVPKASVVVYYIRPDGEMITDQLKIEFGDELQNFVRVINF